MNNYLQRFKTPEQRFWEKVDTSKDCWEWFGAKTKTGYGEMWFVSGRSLHISA